MEVGYVRLRPSMGNPETGRSRTGRVGNEKSVRKRVQESLACRERRGVVSEAGALIPG